MNTTTKRKVPTKRIPVAALAIFMLGCASSQPSSPPPELPEAGPDGEYDVTLPQPPEAPDRFIGLELGADLESCAVEAPKFFYDGTRVRPQDQDQVNALADCLNEPRFADTQVLLIGRTDPRGPEEYNEELGRQRALSVKEALVAGGVAPERVKIASTGESTAVGNQEEYSYGYDRRVDVLQIGLVVEP